MTEELREIVFDTETTGLNARDGDRIIEIGGVELINRFPTGKAFHMFINPEGREVHPEALEIHGISNEFLNDKPTFSQVLDEFMAFFEIGQLVAHNASFDIGFFNAELTRVNRPVIDQARVVDTLLIARRKFPGQRNSLDALCSRFNIDNSHREKHGALLDSELLAEVYIELLGGRQATFALDHGVENTTTDIAAMNDSRETSFSRPSPLPSRLTQADIEKHQEFVKSLGEDAVWKKTGLL